MTFIQWLSSAALAAIFVSIFVYPWQRRLEHAFLLKKEKRELYRQIVRKVIIVRDAIGEANFDGELTKLRSLKDEVFLVAHSYGNEIKLVAKIEDLIEVLCSVNDKTLADQRIGGLMGEGGGILGELLANMRTDLDETTQRIPGWIKDRFSDRRRT